MKKLLLMAACGSLPFISTAQDILGGEIHGNFEINSQFYQQDDAINAPAVAEKVGENSFANINYTSKKVSAGIRFESYLNALQGFDSRYNDRSDIPYKYFTYTADEMEVTAGSFYEQFGSGLSFRSYEEKALGIDNAMNGVRIRYRPAEGLYLKGIWGKQRFYWDQGPGIVRGFDAEVALGELVKAFREDKNRITLGGSVVSKYQKDNDPNLILPQNVATFAGRLGFTRGKVTIGSEYAYKINDPSYVNNFIYKDGHALLVNASYSQKGLGINLGAKRIDNMNSRSDINATKTDLTLNYLPALTKQHTYALAAIYPYATQPNGEIGWQGEIIYTFKKGSGLGGKYGTTLTLNYSQANSIVRTAPPDTNVIGASGTMGYSSEFTEVGKDVYFQDANFGFSKKFSPFFKLNLDYIYLTYNKDVIQGTPGYGTIYSHVNVVEMFFHLSTNHTLRSELQHLYTEQDQGSWAMALLEYSIAPHWYVAALDLYNYGNTLKDKQIHYYNFSAGYTKNTNRIAIGYGKQREGIFCVGGVCRTVPASNGVTLSITSSF